jgi:hypothetical protein
MSALADIRTALADALGSVSGLSTYEVVPGQVNTPAAVIAPDGIEFDTDFDHGATYRFPVQFLVSLGDWGTAQRVIDGYVSHDGTATAALNDDVTDFETRVIGMEGYGLTQFGDTNYLGAQLIVEVIL